MKKIVVIDGKSVFYRGYYAMGALALKDGTATGGVYGFAAIAMEIVNKMKPDKVVVAWDKAGTAIARRKKIYAEYKAGRVKPPEDFFAQIPLLVELVESLGWEFLEYDNYEADDIIGTLGREVRERGDWEMAIISSDLDMLQVVDRNVKMYRLIKGFSEIEEMDVEAVEKKYGIKKEQFLDLKALKGDASDNIPGVAGIGEKGAVKLLAEYGTVEGIYRKLAEDPGAFAPAVRRKLEAGKESAEMSRELALIDTSAPVKLDEVRDFVFEKERVAEALGKLEFRSLIRKFGLGGEAGKGSDLGNGAGEGNVVKITTVTGEKMGDLGDFDGFRDAEEEEILKEYESYTVVEWDVKRKMHEDEEVAEKILKGAKFYDLGQGAFLLDPLARTREEDLFKESEEEKRREFVRQRRELRKDEKLEKILMDFDLPLVPVLYKMEKKGMKISREEFAKLKVEFQERVAKLEREVVALAGEEFNVNSPIQLSEILFGKLGLSTKGIKKTTRGYSTGARELEKLRGAHPIIEKLVEYREAAKLLSTYIVPLPEMADEEGRIHTTFTQNVTATGRLSSLNPNLQNIPVRSEEGRRIREGFVAEKGKVLVSADYSQFELRLAAVLAGDKALIEDFNRGTDIHTKTASEAFGVEIEKVTPAQRRAAKVINFGVLYGMSAKSLGEQAGMSFKEAREFIERYFEIRKPIKEYLEKILAQAREEGYVETFYGRRRPTPDVRSKNFLVRAGAERAAQNMPIQGTEADLVKRAMITVERELPEGAELVMQVHDSLMVECGEEQVEEVVGIMKWVMENIAPELAIRLDVEVKVSEKWE